MSQLDVSIMGQSYKLTCKAGEEAELEQAVRYLDVGALLVMLCYGGMEAEVARANYDLFATAVLPKLKQYDVGGDIGVRYDETLSAAQ